MRRYLCGCPKDVCNGAGAAATNAMGKFVKTHASSKEAYNCYTSWLKSQGYTKVENTSNEFRPPNGGPILLINRPGKFGAILRQGKIGEKGQTGNRVVPCNKGKRSSGGLIISH